MMNRRILIAFAHPDDESFGMGGVIAKYVDEGVDVYYVCTTNGDVGTIPESMQGQYDTIKELRLAELECAAQVLGFKEVFTLGYKDSGMMNAESNQDPDCSWCVWQSNPDRLIRDITKIIRQVRPQVVITFNEYGGYGHPDHIAVQRATTEAFHRANDLSYETEGLPPYQPQKLYHSNIPTILIRIGILIARLRGENPRKIGVNKDIDMQAVLDHVEPTHTRINITRYLDKWNEANACHVSQGGGFRGFLPAWVQRLFGVKQGFTRIYPKPVHNRVDETDFFQGISE